MKKILPFLLAFLPLAAYTQAPPIQWQKCIGGASSEYAQSVIQTNDGGYAVAGWSGSKTGDATKNYGNYDFWVVKLNGQGSIEWQKNYGGSKEEKAYKIIQTTDGGYAVAGYTASSDSDVSVNNGKFDYWLIKISSTGTLQWEKTLGGSDNDIATGVIQTSDGGFVVTGETRSENLSVPLSGCCDAWIVKVNSSGSLVWQTRFGGTGGERASTALEAAGGDIIVLGDGFSSDGDSVLTFGGGSHRDYLLLKLNPAGVIQSWRFIGGSDEDYPQQIIPTTDGGYAIVGYTYSNDGQATGTHLAWQEWWVVKTDASFAIQWQKQYCSYAYDMAYGIAQTTDGGFIIGGHSNTLVDGGDFSIGKGLYDVWILKINTSGSIVWKKNYGGSGTDYLLSLDKTTDGSIVFAGATDTNNNGDVSGNHGGGDWWVVKLGVPTTIEELNKSKLTIYPNPANNELNISVDESLIGAQLYLYNTTGVLLQSMSIETVNSRFEITNYPTGTYIMEIKTKDAALRKIWTKL